MSEQRRTPTRPGPRPVTLSLGARPASMPAIAPLMADGSFDLLTGSQSLHAAALSLLDEDTEPKSTSSGSSLREVGTPASAPPTAKPSGTSSSSPTDVNTFYTAPSMDETRTSRQPSRLSFYTAEGDEGPDHDQETEHAQSRSNSARSLKPYSDIDLLLQRRASFPIQVPDDRDSPELDNVFEPDVSPQRNSLLFPSGGPRSRRSSAYTAPSTAPSRSASFGERQTKLSPSPSPLSSPTKAKFDGLPAIPDQDGDYKPGLPYPPKRKSTLRINGNGTHLPKSETVSSEMTAVASASDMSDSTEDSHPPRPSAPTPNKSIPRTVDNLVPVTPSSPTHMLSATFATSPDGGAPPSTVTMADMLQDLKRQDSVHPEPKAKGARSAKPLTVKGVEQYAAFCATVWLKAGIAVVHSIGKPSHALHILVFAALSSLLPVIQYAIHLSQDLWSAARTKYRIPSIPQLLKLKHENDYTLFDCLSHDQAEAGKLALSLARHSDIKRIFDLDAARLLLQLCGLLELRQVREDADRFAKQGEQYVRLAAASVGLEYTPVSELNSAGEACCAAFYDLKSNWIVLAFKGESIAELDEVIKNAISPSVHLGQHIHGFGKVRSCYANRLFPPKHSADSRIPYHTIIRTVRIIASQLATDEPIQLYFTGHGAGGAIASLAMAAALDAKGGEFGETVRVGDGYVFGSGTVCDKKSLREFEHKVAKHWERPSVLWRVVNPNDSLATHKSWNLDTSTQHYLGTTLLLPPNSSKILPPHASQPQSSRSTLSASYAQTPRLGRSLQPERALMDTRSRLERLVQDWPGVGGVVQHSLGAYWEILRGGREVVLDA